MFFFDAYRYRILWFFFFRGLWVMRIYILLFIIRRIILYFPASNSEYYVQLFTLYMWQYSSHTFVQASVIEYDSSDTSSLPRLSTSTWKSVLFLTTTYIFIRLFIHHCIQECMSFEYIGNVLIFLRLAIAYIILTQYT